MQSPLIIDARGDVEMFHSETSASLYLEAIDVRNDEYIGYDAAGYRLSITADKYDKVHLSRTSPENLCTDELLTVLSEYAIRRGHDKGDIARKDLRQLVRLVSIYTLNSDQ